LWLQVGAEVGFPGLACLLAFYVLCVFRLMQFARGKHPGMDPWFTHLARMAIAALIGFMVSAQFVSLKGLEHPIYVVLMGACVLKLTGQRSAAAALQTTPVPLARQNYGGLMAGKNHTTPQHTWVRAAAPIPQARDPGPGPRPYKETKP